MKQNNKTGGLVYNVKTKDWSGQLPKNCRSVYVQWLDDGEWKGIIDGDLQHTRPRTEAVEAIERAVAHGPCRFPRYRLMPATIQNEGDLMASKGKKKTVKANGSQKQKLELVAGELRPGSFNAVLYQALEKGGSHTIDALAKLVPGCKNVKGRLIGLIKRGLSVAVEEGKWSLRTAAKKPTTARKPAARKPAGKAVSEKPAATGTVEVEA